MSESCDEVGQASVLVEALRLQRAWDFATARSLLVGVLAGPSDVEVGLAARNMIAEIRRETDDPAGALADATALVEECETTFGRRHPRTVQAIALAGMIRHDLGDLDAAEVLYHQVLDSGVDEAGPGGRAVRLTRANFALLHHDWGNEQLALTLLAAAYAVQRRFHGTEDLDSVRMAAQLAEMHRDSGDIAAARRLFDVARRGARTQLGEDHPFTRALERESATVEPVVPTRMADQP